MPFLLSTRDRGLAHTHEPLNAIPERQGACCRGEAGGQRGRRTQDDERGEKYETHAQRKRQQGDGCDAAGELDHTRRIVAVFHDLVKCPGGKQQTNCDQHEPQAHHLQHLQFRRQTIEPGLKYGLELEPEQNLRAKNQHARLVERVFHLVGQVRHARTLKARAVPARG